MPDACPSSPSIESYAYEDFVEGIRPVLSQEQEDGPPKYECRDGLFKQMAINALFSSLERVTTTGKEGAFDARWAALIERIERDPAQEYDGLTGKTEDLYALEVSARGNIGPQPPVSRVGQIVCQVVAA